MTTRRAVVDTLERLAFAAELEEDPRARIYGQAAWAVRSMDGDLRAKRESGELADVRGIGKGMIEIIDSVLDGQRPEALVRFEQTLPTGLFEIRRIKGLGAKKIKALWTELGISTLGELEYACRENRLVDLKGFGKKTQSSVLTQIDELRKTDGQVRRDRARALLEAFVAALRAQAGVAQAIAVGEFRRGLELVRELEVLVVGDDLEQAIANASAARPPEAQIAVHTGPADQFGALAAWTTGSAEHVAELSARAKDKGLIFDERGLHTEKGEAVACGGEDELYRRLGLVPTDPERREAGVPLVLEGKARPLLVTREDLRGALHNHTVASDGSATLEQMRDAAAARRLDYLGISEHSISAFYARGLDADTLRAQARTIAEMNETGSPCVLLTGVESDILAEGTLDYAGDVLSELDVIVASVHRRHSQDAAQMTARLVAAARNPWTSVIGHPTGRLLLGRAPSELDMEAFLDACAESGCAVELNANPARLDLHDRHLAMAKERGVFVSVAADAHSVDELDNLAYGITIARRGGLTAEDVLNTRTLDELRAWLGERRALNAT